MPPVPALSDNLIESICGIIGDTDRGLTGSAITRYLGDLGFLVPDPQMTKCRRLSIAFQQKQSRDGYGNSILAFIERVMDPVSYTGTEDSYNLFDWRRFELNRVLSFAGYQIGIDGRISRVTPVTNLDEANQRAGRLRRILYDRQVHPAVLSCCKPELLNEDYFHAVLEATKSIARRIRQMSGSNSDGASLIEDAFGGRNGRQYPLLAFNKLSSPAEMNEHNGLINIMKGVFSAFRNPTAHEPRIDWTITEQDAMDLLTIASFLHRRLDKAVRT